MSARDRAQNGEMDRPRDDPRRWLNAELLRELLKLNPARAGRELIVPDYIAVKVPQAELFQILHEVERLRGLAAEEGPPDLLELRMAANGRRTLLDHLRKVGSFQLGDWQRALRLFDFGAESFVFLGEDQRSGESVIVKFPFVDYTDLAQLNVDHLMRRRQLLVHEAEMLRALRGTALPEFVAEQTTLNPFFPAGLPPFLRTEQFLIMEFIRGVRVDTMAYALHQQGRSCCNVRLAVQFAVAFLRLAIDIERTIGPTAAYTDIKPENALIQGTTVRVVDAASIVYDVETDAPFAVSEAYLDPIDLEQWRAGILIPDTAYMLRSLVRCMRMLASTTPTFVGQASPDWPREAQELGAMIDALSSRHDVTAAEAAAELTSTLEHLSCSHGTGAMSTPNNIA